MAWSYDYSNRHLRWSFQILTYTVVGEKLKTIQGTRKTRPSKPVCLKITGVALFFSNVITRYTYSNICRVSYSHTHTYTGLHTNNTHTHSHIHTGVHFYALSVYRDIPHTHTHTGVHVYGPSVYKLVDMCLCVWRNIQESI